MMLRMVRKFIHTIRGDGTGWSVAERNRLLSQVGQVERVQARVAVGKGLEFRTHVFDGQVREQDCENVPGEDHAYRSTSRWASASLELSVNDACDEPFNAGLTPAVEVLACDSSWMVVVIIHAKLL